MDIEYLLINNVPRSDYETLSKEKNKLLKYYHAQHLDIDFKYNQNRSTIGIFLDGKLIVKREDVFKDKRGIIISLKGELEKRLFEIRLPNETWK